MANRLMWIVWPAFLAACALELLVFAVVDPLELQWSGHALGWTRQAVYAFGFFTFWLVTLAACGLTTLLRMSPAEVNRCPFDPAQRPSGCPGNESAPLS
ncbi:hypothetical protein [Ramlibacter pallidus]|uniref:Transmembrane protein n=1 Tax=Ramlibacter pallidus TaxID=2780087 RepID=A0ABR9S2M0_9BURK|nr:hypothetical protein [Ramlibacter pallidus]MBE7367745.1 hypothetical protein [Ramlibacter pallidus]